MTRGHVQWSGLLVSIVLTACGHQADVTLQSGHTVSGEIVRADATTLTLKRDDGSVAPVARADIADVDHPGDAAAVLGGVLTGVGAAGLGGAIYLFVEGSDAGLVGLPLYFIGAFVLTGSLAALGTGIPVLVWGVNAHDDSVERSQPASATLSPALLLDPALQTAAFGAKLTY